MANYKPFVSFLKLIPMGVKGGATLMLLVDTGSTYTIIEPEALMSIGCDPATATASRRVFTAGGPVTLPRLSIPQFHCVGQVVEDYDALAYTLLPEVHVDELLGMDFLKRFSIEIKPRSEEIVVRNI